MTTAMTTGKSSSNGAVQLAPVFAKAATEIDEIATRYAVASQTSNNRFTQSFVRAQAMQDLRRCISSDVMAMLMTLQGSALGFKTDKDRDGGYSAEIVKEAFIEATLRGAYPTGNEWNIIAGRAYLTKECYDRLVRSIPGIDNIRLRPGVPAMSSGGALVPFIISGTLGGKKWEVRRLKVTLADGSEIDERICVRVNSQMGADAIIGKATRKILKMAYEYLTGSRHEDLDDADDVLVHQDSALLGSEKPAPTRMEQITQQLQEKAAKQGLSVQMAAAAGEEAMPEPTAVVPAVPSKSQKKPGKAQLVAKITADIKTLGWEDPDVGEFLSRWNVDRIEDLSVGQAEEAVAALMGLLAQKAG